MPESQLEIIYKQDIQTELFLKIVDLVSENLDEDNVKEWASMYLSVVSWAGDFDFTKDFFSDVESEKINNLIDKIGNDEIWEKYANE